MSLTIHAGDDGKHFARKDGAYLCGDDKDTLVRSAQFACDAGVLAGKVVAWIGGGMCVGPKIFCLTGCTQTVYEIEPLLEEYCPEGVSFVLGDWRDTISGAFDVIVYDLGGETPSEELSRFLNPGGIILPKEG